MKKLALLLLLSSPCYAGTITTTGSNMSIIYSSGIAAQVVVGGAITYVQGSTMTYGGGGGSQAHSNVKTVTAGNLLVASCVESATTCTQVVTDSLANTWTSVGINAIDYSNLGTPSLCVKVYYAKNITGGSDTVYCSDQTNWPNGETGVLHEYSGASITAPFDVASSSSQVTPAPNPISNPITTTVPNELVFSYLFSSDLPSGAGSGTLRFQYKPNNANNSQDTIVTIPGSYTSSWTADSQYFAFTMIQAGFK